MYRFHPGKKCSTIAFLKNVLHKIQTVYPLSVETLHLFTSRLELVEFPKGHQLAREGRTGSKLYLIEHGIARAYSMINKKEITFWFGVEGDLAMSYYSYIANKPGYETVELLEDSTLYSIGLEELQQLFNTNIEMANWGRKFAEIELVKTEQIFMSRQSLSATVRYQQLLEQNPQLIRRVQLGYIASYLGVTQVTLSRIRAAQKGTDTSAL